MQKSLVALLAFAPLAALHSELSEEQFDSVYAICLPEAEESSWLALDWETDLWKAREQAAREGKPIFLWEMDGHPLGCT